MLREFTDHLGRTMRVDWPPQRIISLCPSLTETLHRMDLAKRIVGRTRFCIHPHPQVKAALNVGGTKQVDYNRIASLQPDLIIAEKEENTRDTIAVLEQSYPVYVADVKTVAEAIRMIRDLGALTDRGEQAEILAQAIEDRVRESTPGTIRTMAYLIWQQPYMAAGGDTYLDDLLTRFGFINVFGGREQRYPEVQLAELQSLKPAVVFLSSEPFPFGESHRAALQAVLPESRVLLIDGEISWYGARMEWAFPYLGALTDGRIRRDENSQQ